MAINIGDAHSSQRKKVWFRVVWPIGAAARASGWGSYPSGGQAAFESATRSAAGPTWQLTRNNAKSMAEAFGMSDYNHSSSLHTLSDATAWAARFKAEAAAQTVPFPGDAGTGPDLGPGADPPLYADELYSNGDAWSDGEWAPPLDSSTTDEGGGMPTWGWFAIGAGVLLIGGVGVWAMTRDTATPALGAAAWGYRTHEPEFNGSYYIDL